MADTQDEMVADTTHPLLRDNDPSPTPSTAPIVSVRGVSKMYRIYDRPVDRLKQMVWRGRRSYGREFWALRDVSFDIHRGETVGIIGRNGSGKSTLLQIIAGTLTPTQGEVQVRGRVAALLELGSGFNPEFTGRENVFLNGAVLGFSQAEMEARFEEIAAFADIGQFIDQPVKTYSSGMVIRLAFAVTVTMQPDILIVDEALAVGDIAFVGKCLNRIARFIDCGGTLLVVSHDIGMIKNMTRRCLFLEDGQAHYFGETVTAAALYTSSMMQRELLSEQFTDPTCGYVIEQVEIQDTISRMKRVDYRHNDSLTLAINIRIRAPSQPAHFIFNVYNYLGQIVFGGETLLLQRDQGLVTLYAVIEHVLLAPGNYSVNVAIAHLDTLDYVGWWRNAASFQVSGAMSQTFIYHQPYHWEVSDATTL